MTMWDELWLQEAAGALARGDLEGAEACLNQTLPETPKYYDAEVAGDSDKSPSYDVAWDGS